MFKFWDIGSIGKSYGMVLGYLRQIRLDWSAINRVHNCPLEDIIAVHSGAFREGLGTLKGAKAKK